MMKKSNEHTKRIFLSPPYLNGNEKDYVEEAIRSNYIAPLGPQVDEFEKEIARLACREYALAVSSGTAAIHLALRSVAVSAGDVVIASTFTFIGSVSPLSKGWRGYRVQRIDQNPTSNSCLCNNGSRF